MKLPPVCNAPLDHAERRARLGAARWRFVESVVSDAPIFDVRKTGTKVDVGYWLGKRRIWLCVLEREMLLFALGRRPYVERIALQELGETQYNHVTGELVLAPAETASVGALKLAPLAALEILAHLVEQGC